MRDSVRQLCKRLDPRTEKSLREAEHRFRTIYDNISDGIFLLNLETRQFALCNRSCLRMLGYTQEEFTKLGIPDLHPEADLPFIYAQIEEFLQGGKPIRHDVRFKRKDGSILLADLSPDWVRLGGRRYIVAILKDITERTRMEEELRRYAERLEELAAARTVELQESERRYRSLAENDPDIIQRFDRDLRHLYVNPAFERATGLSRDAVIGKTARELGLSADLARLWEQTAHTVYQTGESRILRFEMPTPTGRRHYEAHLVPESGRDGSVEQVLAITRDITQRVQAENTLKESLEREKLLADLVRHASIAVGVGYPDGRLGSSNPAFSELTGYTEEELKTMDWNHDLTPPEWREREAAKLEELTRTGKAVRYEKEYTRKDGSRVPVELSVHPRFDSQGNLQSYFSFVTDTTERKQAEEELRQLSRKNEEALRVAHMGHWEFDITTGMFTFNDQYYALHGTTAREAGGYQMTAEEFAGKYVHPDDAHLVQESIQKAATAANPDFQFQIEARILCTDGEARWVTVWFRIEKDAQGKTTKLYGVNQDITERRQAEEALREKEYLLSESQRIGHVGTWSVNLATYAVTWTEETYRLYGVSPDTFVPSADTLIGLLHPEDRHAMREWIRAALAGEDAGVLEVHVVLADGSLRVLSGCDQRIPAHGDTPARLVGTVQDVTQQKLAQEALRESEERYRILLEHSFDGIFVHEDFRIVQLNDRLAQMTGYAHSELVGSKAIDLFAPDSQETIRQYIRSGVRDYYEVELRRRDGRIVQVESFGAPCKFQGRDARIVGLRDITERKRAEEALRESEERFRAAFEEGAVAMALTALDSTLLKVNSAFCRMLGFNESELVGRSFVEITHPDDRTANFVGTQRLACGAAPSFRMEKRYLRKDGAVIWAEMSTASVRDARGQPLYCVTHIHDVTDRRQAEEALCSLNDRLELQVAQRTEDLRHTVGRLQQLTLEISQTEDRERRRIADLLHDDVQQTLAAAKFHLNLLSSEPRSAAESQEIVEQVKQMLKDAIEKSRSLSHELSPVLYQVDLTEVLNWLACHMQRKHGLTVHVEAHGPVDSSSEPLKALLYKVTQELLFNVVKHAEVREARIRVRRLGRYIYLSVADRGLGFDPQRLEGAVGFGLLGIRERVQLLGGQMKIRSTCGVGSRILIAVPDEEPFPAAASTESGDGWVQTPKPQEDRPEGPHGSVDTTSPAQEESPQT